MTRQLVHACALTIPFKGDWYGVLIIGPSGVGKSDLSLRAVNTGFTLVSDDYCQVFVSGNRLYATAPPQLYQKIEVRGLGIKPVASRPLTRLDLAVFLQTLSPERMPLAEHTQILGLSLPTIRLCAYETSSVDKMKMALFTQ